MTEGKFFVAVDPGGMSGTNCTVYRDGRPIATWVWQSDNPEDFRELVAHLNGNSLQGYSPTLAERVDMTAKLDRMGATNAELAARARALLQSMEQEPEQ